MSRKRSRRPTMYVDTNIVSVLYYRGVNMRAVYRQMATKHWWDTERASFDIFASVFTEAELRAGTYPGQEESILAVRRLRYLPFTSDVRRCRDTLIAEKVVPQREIGDATQLAFATVHRVDYLLTWNYAHLANPDTQSKLTALAQREGWRAPNLVSPENIPRDSLGQPIRRKDNG